MLIVLIVLIFGYCIDCIVLCQIVLILSIALTVLTVLIVLIGLMLIDWICSPCPVQHAIPVDLAATFGARVEAIGMVQGLDIIMHRISRGSLPRTNHHAPYRVLFLVATRKEC